MPRADLNVPQSRTSRNHKPETAAWVAWLTAKAAQSDRVTISARFALALARQLEALEREAAA